VHDVPKIAWPVQGTRAGFTNTLRIIINIQRWIVMLNFLTNQCLILNFIINNSQVTNKTKAKVKKTKQKQRLVRTKPKKKIPQAAELKDTPVKTRPPRARTVTPRKKVVRAAKVKRRPATGKTDKASKEKIPDEVKWMQEDPQDQLLSRFVETPKGTRVGESIGIEKKRIILKNKLKFYSIPLKYVKEKDDVLILRRKVNWSVAEKLGEAWRKNALDVIPKNKPKPVKKTKAK
jgi:hypothetical protein